jgi:hypothetical protein
MRHRDLILANAMSGHRPEEWWIYEKGRRSPGRDETAVLYSMGELSKAETENAMRMWRFYYAQTQDPEFSLALEPGKFLEGAAARRAHFKWAGIPRELIKAWNAEHKRQATTIRKLERAD